MIKFDIITIFPNIFNSYFEESIIKRAQKKKLVKINIHNLRDYTRDKHKTVDDKPYGGGPGMILKPDIIYKALCSLSKTKNKKQKIKNKRKIILLTPSGKQFNQKTAYRYSKIHQLILICGHYEGVDARVEKFVDEKISIGSYVLTGGELPAMIVVDAVSRFIPGVLGKYESLEEIKGSYPVYTRPAILTIQDKSGKIKKLKVPSVLLSGNHQRIREWRMVKSKIKNKR